MQVGITEIVKNRIITILTAVSLMIVGTDATVFAANNSYAFNATRLFARGDANVFFRNNIDRSLGELNKRAVEQMDQQHPDSAILYLSMASTLYEDGLRKGEDDNAVLVMNNLGVIYIQAYNDYVAAAECFLKGKEIAEERGLNSYIPLFLLNLSDIYLIYEDYEKALDFNTQAFHEAKEYADYKSVDMALLNLMVISQESNYRLNLLPYIQEWEAMDTSTPWNQYVSFLCESEKKRQQGLIPESIALADSASVASDRVESYEESFRVQKFKLWALLSKSRLWLENGNAGQALASAREALPLIQSVGDKDLGMSLYGHLALLYKLAGKPDSAQAYHYRQLEAKYDLFKPRQLGSVHDLINQRELDKLGADLRHEQEVKSLMVVIFSISLILGLGVIVLLTMLWIKTRREKETLNALYQRAVEKMKQPMAATSLKYATSSLTDDAKDDLFDRITDVFNNSEELYSPDFTASRLAELTGSTEKEISQVFAERFGNNFNVMLAESRVRRACQMISDEEAMKQYNLGAIAELVGFRSRSHFSTVFKKVTGLSPSEFHAVKCKVDRHRP